MAEWRLWRSWPAAAIKLRLEQARHSHSNDGAHEEDMTGDHGWHHFNSEAVIATEAEGEDRFARARAALANYQFSAPAIVLAHFDPAEPLLWRCMLLEVQVLGLHHLCPAVVNRVTDEADVFGFRDDTLEGHLERGVEWFLITRNDQGQIRFRIERAGSRASSPTGGVGSASSCCRGATSESGIDSPITGCGCSRTMARHDSRRETRLDSPTRGVDVVFTYHTKRKWFK
ncbi:hypothetical protein LuPra_05082 [Luteitalea pratensis]|uniref:DUF1990 domain-containing protein n=1 Tax=Luteitalea pratensis TaxID=1855912 RepID=A0A143PSW1_LUTPR|nr:DUF1990 family protein [Luteitalea pratensis]AMY11817.1 hypothetical protein LuPra_05082 [Luteitalea pratensis]